MRYAQWSVANMLNGRWLESRIKLHHLEHMLVAFREDYEDITLPNWIFCTSYWILHLLPSALDTYFMPMAPTKRWKGFHAQESAA